MQITPPLVSGGLPVIGHAIEFQRNREKLMQRGFAEGGDIFTIKLGPQPVAVISGAENNKIFYKETDNALNINESMEFLKETFGEVLLAAPPEVYDNQRPLLQALFSRQRMVDYVEAMNAEVQLWIDGLQQSGVFEISAEMLKLTQNVAGHAFIGPNFRDELDDSFWELYIAIANSIDMILPPHWPLTKFKARDHAKEQIRDIFRPIITARRHNPDQYDDLISQIITTPLRDGSMMSDEDVVSLFMGLLFAGHETTAGQAAWTVIQLLQNPSYLKLVEAEIAEHAPLSQPLDGGTMRKLKHVYYAIDETTRMYPSAEIGIRLAKQPVQFGDYTVPDGWRVMVNSINSHNAPAVYAHPDLYDPLRFSPERREGSAHDIIGFGGGRHKCTGMNFARNEMAVIVARLFQQMGLRLLDRDTEVQRGLGANRPTPTQIAYQRRK